jgi:two-component system, LuxR family, sensor kinase FixL
MRKSLIERLIGLGRARLLGAAAVLLALATFADWRSGLDISLGVFYVVPLMLGAMVLERNAILLAALACSVLRTYFTVAQGPLDAAVRFMFAVIAYSAAGLFVLELVKNRRLVLDHVAEIERQQALRREIEEHLRVLAESSPAAIFTLDGAGRALSANRAARLMLGYGEEDITGVSVDKHLPVLANALQVNSTPGFMRTAIQCQGVRRDGDPFAAQIWFSTYQVPSGRRLAAIAVDASEELREREEQSLLQMQTNNRIIAGAVSHEIRNVAGAIAMVFSSLRRAPTWTDSDDAKALGALIEALHKIAATDLQSKARLTLNQVDLREVLTQLRIIVEPAWRAIDGAVLLDVPLQTPPVLADSNGLLQALLNLSQNSLRAVASSDKRMLRLSVEPSNGRVLVRVEDTGPGVRDPKRLFEPFQQGADHVGLGLYVSRALLRSFGGDLRFEGSPGGPARFVAELQAAQKQGVEAA